ncbi:MAG TPA: hypothetical protein VHX11_03025 [Acidobacteriaceae bacterium]|jgi:hypothetical protein|nr:hypothetical protein [Acidobacteriaceae bacterium]
MAKPEAETGIAIELGKFASLLLSILSLYALFHTIFLMPADSMEDRIVGSLRMLALAGAASWTSGWIFRYEETVRGETEPQRPLAKNPGVASTFPMRLFWWTTAILLGLFLSLWFLQVYFLPPNGLLRH